MQNASWMNSVEDVMKQRDELLLSVSDLRTKNEKLTQELEVF
jgi:hypothetical protein